MATPMPELPRPLSVSVVNCSVGSVELRDNYTADQMQAAIEAAIAQPEQTTHTAASTRNNGRKEMKWIEAAYGLYLLEAGNGEVLESIKTSAYDGTATVAGSNKQYTTLAAAKSAALANIVKPVPIATSEEMTNVEIDGIWAKALNGCAESFNLEPHEFNTDCAANSALRHSFARYVIEAVARSQYRS